MSVGILGETARNDEIRRQELLRNQYHGTDSKPAFQIPMRLSNIVQRVLPDIFDADSRPASPGATGRLSASNTAVAVPAHTTRPVPCHG
jgi:hypothetical protein